jgi:tRNA modification GTPase
MAKAFSSGLSSVLAGGADTIVARSSAAGRGAVAVIRATGPAVRDLAARVVPELDIERPWRASLVAVHDEAGRVIDRGIAVIYHGPRSYTGEDMLELTVHGAPWIIRQTQAALCASGGRPAQPGEFTRRAVANGKMDLVQAEAINDLASAETAWQARLARAQSEGALSERFRRLRDVLVEVVARLEASLDFSDHEAAAERAVVDAALADAGRRLRGLLATASAARRVRDGVRVVIAGPPNAGKSTLFNLLVGHDGAIVSPHPGTTRDLLVAEIEVAGVPVVLHDTAGVGAADDARDPVELEGVRRAGSAVAEADLVLLLAAGDDPREAAMPGADGPTTMRIRSKWDLEPSPEPPPGWIALSCHTGQGVDELRGALASAVSEEVADLGGEWAISERHRAALARAQAELEQLDPTSPELGVEHGRRALDAVRELTGEVVTEDLLDRIFATFCIGK